MGAYGTAIYSFLADLSHPSMLAFRMAMLHIAESLGRPIGTQLGSLLIINTGNDSPLVNTSVSFGMLFLSSILLWYRIRRAKWTPQRKVLVVIEYFGIIKSKSFQALSYLEAVHPKVAWEAIKTTLKPRERNARRYLVLVSITINHARANDNAFHIFSS